MMPKLPVKNRPTMAKCCWGEEFSNCLVSTANCLVKGKALLLVAEQTQEYSCRIKCSLFQLIDYF